MSVTPDYLRYIIDQLTSLDRVTSRRMFGGVGLYCDGLFFGIISADTVYFKVDDSNRAIYEARGMDKFRPFRDKPQLSMNYYEVPADVIEDPEELAAWARRSLAVAITPKKPAAVKQRKRKF